MPKAILEISGFEYGITVDPTIPAKNGFSFCSGMDIHSKPGYLRASPASSAMSDQTGSGNGINVNNDLVKWQRYYSKAGKMFGFGHDTSGNGTLYAYMTALGSTAASIWTKVHAVSTVNGGGMEEFNDRLYYASDANLGRTEDTTLSATINSSTIDIKVADTTGFPSSGDLLIDSEVIQYTGVSGTTNGYFTGCTRGSYGSNGITHTSAGNVFGFTDDNQAFTDDDDKWHPMKVYVGKLCIGDGRYIATLDADDTFTATALTMPDGYRVRCSAIYNDLLAIGTWQGTNIYDIADATLFTWDGVSELPNQALSLKENGIQAVYPWNNLLIVFAGIFGKAYQFDGSSLTPLTQVPGIYEADWGEIFPDAVAIDKNGNLLFGFSGSGSGGANFYGIYSLGRATTAQPIALTGAYLASSGQSNVNIYSIIKAPTTSVIYFTYYDSVTYGGEVTSTSAKYTTQAYMESQIYDIGRNGQAGILNGVELIANPMAASTGCTVSFKINNEASYTNLGQITATNQTAMIRGFNRRARTLQLKLSYLCSANDSPEVSAIKVY